MVNDDVIQKVVKEISEAHGKIIDDWCKAYLAQLYEEGKSFEPGSFILCEQELHEHNGKWVKKYWFERKEFTTRCGVCGNKI
jgi:hypothetical protein